MPAPESWMRTRTRPALRKVATRRRGIGCSEHCVLGVEHQVQNDLLQLAVVAVDERQLRIEVCLDANLRGLELVFQQRERVAQQVVQIDVGELASAGA